MRTLKDFIRYLREERIRELAEYELKLIKGMDIPIVKLFQRKGLIKDLEDETTIKMTVESLKNSLLALENGTAYDNAKVALKQWAEDKLPGIGKNEIQPSDLILIYAAQKKSYQYFLPQFTSDAGEAISILAEIEEFQTKVQGDAIQMLFEIQKETEGQLKDSQERFRLMIQNVKDYSIIMVNVEGKVQSWNEGAQRMYGYAQEEILGRHMSVFYTENEIRMELPENNLKQAMEKGHYEAEVIKVRKNGSLFWARTLYTPVYDEAGKLKGFSKIARDISESKKAEEELRSVNNFLNSVLENIPNMIFVKDAKDLRFVRFNKAGETLLGHSKEDLLGKNDYDFFPKEQADFFTQNDHAVLNQSDIIDIPEEPIDTKRGPRWLHTKKIPIFDRSGKPVYLLGISEDITEMRSAKLELEYRTKELERSNAELEQFAYVASHDLQEPLRTISSYVQLLASRYKDKLDEDANEFIDFAVDGSKRMRQLINSLLEYSRVNRSKPFEWVDINDVIKEIKVDIKDQIKDSGAVIKYNNMPKIYGDYVLLGQLFQNLIGNAIKFRRDNSPEIHISSERKNGSYVFAVKDNGIGIPKEYNEKIFIIFQRLNNREKYPGTGIGLSICKKIVEKHGGTIWVESEPGKGSSFFFTLNADK